MKNDRLKQIRCLSEIYAGLNGAHRAMLSMPSTLKSSRIMLGPRQSLLKAMGEVVALEVKLRERNNAL